VVFGAGYIFAYNLPVMSRLGVNLYQTVTLLIIAYSASSLPTNARVLVGPSGSGKTTLLRCLAGIERVTAGRIRIGSRTVASDRAHMPPDQRDLSMVFQDYALWPHLSARDNVAAAGVTSTSWTSTRAPG
jgi:ABC-type Fe3+/spermidine/putrescine transport system ATPase subunit